jgi:hypothetical protein
MTNKDIFKETFPLQYQEGGEHYKNLIYKG